jgi:integrase
MGVYSKEGKDGKLRWYIDFYADGIRKRECVGHSKTLAKKALAKRTTEVSEERYINKPKGGVLFKEFAEQWLEERKAHLKKSSYYDYKGILDLYLIPTFGKKRLGKVTETDIENLIRDLKDRLSNKRINNIIVPLKTLFKTAYRRKSITSNPIDGIGMLRVDRTEIMPFSMEEVRLFLDKVDSHFRDYFEVAFFTAMRPSEQIALKWDNIDFKRGKINVVDARVMGEESAPKTVASRRAIDMLPPVKEALERQSEKTFLGSPYVFVSKKGNIVDIGNLRKRTWYPALVSAELKRRTMYQSRHTFGTLMLSAGENPNWVARMMGHTSVEMLFKKYSGFIPNVTHQDGTAFMGKLYKDGHFLDTCNKKGLKAKP